ncbi:sugar phosphate nucleotidyltransferase [Cognatishimia sp. D5M38]|uniref:Sugar phosphate nucleotidyltransferase n=1 Tax=Cognatishimia coralii TaxID=3083254 RepID=A0ABU8QB74_9RHOB
MKDITPVILCGGSGARLWPMSRDLNPKQFQPVEGVGSQTFFQQTLLRHVAPGFGVPFVVSGSRYAHVVTQQLAALGRKAHVLLEPLPRGTGPAVLAAALTLARKDPKALMLVAPSDHVIRGDVTKAIKTAATAAQSGHIVVFGVTPRYAETGFGYILDTGRVAGLDGVRRCGGFVEKPSHFKASQLIASGSAYWASGISLFTAETLITEFARFAPETLEAVKAAVCGAQENLLSRPSYARAANGSTEQMIFERSDRMLMMPLDVEWDDVGCWTSMHAIGDQDAEGNLLHGDVLSVETKNSMVRADGKLVAVVGVSDLIVVDTPDALLVTKRGRCQSVRHVVERLKKTRRQEARSFPHDPTQSAPSDFSWGESLRLKQAGQVDMSLLRIAGGSAINLKGTPDRQIVLLAGRLNVMQNGKSSWLSTKDQLVLEQGAQAHLENPDDSEVEALMMTHRGSAQVHAVPEVTHVALDLHREVQ